MAFGLVMRDAYGAVVIDTGTRLLRVMHVERVGVNDPPRAISVPRLRADRAWWITQPDNAYRRGPVAAVHDGYIDVQGGGNAGTTRADNGYIIVVGWG
jgi:hypothetical protein